MDTKPKITRTRCWVSIGYPESLKPNWLDILSESCVKCIVSPLHDKDTNPDGEPKKPHYHIVTIYNGPKTELQANSLFAEIGAIRGQAVNDLQAQCRYLIHRDNPEKYQYDAKDIKQFGGADWSEIIRSSSERYASLKDIIHYIKDNNICSYCNFIDWCSENNDEWFKVACDNTVFLKEYLKSRSWTQNQELQKSNSKTSYYSPY